MKTKPTLSTATLAEIKSAFHRLTDRLGTGICQLCDASFKKKRKAQRFCCPSCKAIWWRLKNEIEAEKKRAAAAAWIEAAPEKASEEGEDWNF